MTRAYRLGVLLIPSLTLALSSALSGCSSSDLSSNPPLDSPLDAQEDINVTSEAIKTSPVCVNIRRGVLGDVGERVDAEPKLFARAGRGRSTSFATSEVAEVRDRPRLKVCFIPPAPQETCEMAGQPISFEATDILDWFVDSEMLATDGVNIFASAAVSDRIYTIDPVGFNVVSFFNAPNVGNTALAVDPSSGDFFYGQGRAIGGSNYRLSSCGAVELGPSTIPDVIQGQIWDNVAGELHVALDRVPDGTGEIQVYDANYNLIETYGAPVVIYPMSVAINYTLDRIVVTDMFPVHLVHIFDRTTRAWIKTIDGTMSGMPFGNNGLSAAVSEAGTIWVVDRANNRVVAFDMDGNWIQTLTGLNEPVAAVYHEATHCLFVAEYNGSFYYGAPSRLFRFCGCP